MRRTFLTMTALVAVGATTLLSGMAAAGHDDHTLVVGTCRHGDFTTIQAAVNAAVAGTKILVCPGTYHEMVTIGATKDGLDLEARGDPETVIVEGDVEDPNHAPEAGFLLSNVHGVQLEGFTVRGFHDSDILLDHADGNTIRNNRTTQSAHDGIQLNHSSRNLIEHNVSFGNVASPPAGHAFSDACGVLVRQGSAGNVIRHNEFFGNAFGVLIGGAGPGNVVFHNDSHDNRRYGILNRATADTVIDGNRIDRNGIPLGPGRGISVESPAAVISTGVTVARNDAFGNTPDLFWDGKGADTFQNNHCDTSVPDGLCVRDKGEGAVK
jgi:parallel beta-helix repeat protein